MIDTSAPDDEPIWAQNVVLFLNVVKLNILKEALYRVASPWDLEIAVQVLDSALGQDRCVCVLHTDCLKDMGSQHKYEGSQDDSRNETKFVGYTQLCSFHTIFLQFLLFFLAKYWVLSLSSATKYPSNETEIDIIIGERLGTRCTCFYRMITRKQFALNHYFVFPRKHGLVPVKTTQ